MARRKRRTGRQAGERLVVVELGWAERKLKGRQVGRWDQRERGGRATHTVGRVLIEYSHTNTLSRTRKKGNANSLSLSTPSS